MTKSLEKLKQIAGYDDIMKKKDLLKDAEYDYKKLGLGLLSCFLGLYSFLFLVNSVWMNILLKIIGIFLFMNGLGFILGCFHFDDKIHNKMDKRTDNKFFKRK